MNADDDDNDDDRDDEEEGEAAAFLRHTTNCAPAESISVSREPAPKHFSKLFPKIVK